MKYFLLILLIFFQNISWSQNQKTKILTVGTFHFAFRNRDIRKIDKKDQIDVLDKKYQSEIEGIVKRIATFKPTIIAIEREPGYQHSYDSLLAKYLAGEHPLGRDEVEQIGFRMAKLTGIQTIYCVNDWGLNYPYIDSVIEKDTAAYRDILDKMVNNPDSDKVFLVPEVFKKKGIRAQLRLINNEQNQQRDLGNYLVGIFKYEKENNPFWGSDYVTGWWFNRNLHIFRNIQKIPAKPTDRILVIYGGGHLNLINLFIKASPEYELVKATKYLR